MLRIKNAQLMDSRCKGCGRPSVPGHSDISSLGYCDDCEKSLPRCRNCSQPFEGENGGYCTKCQNDLFGVNQLNRNVPIY